MSKCIKMQYIILIIVILFQILYNNYYFSFLPRQDDHYLALLNTKSSELLKQKGYGYSAAHDEDSIYFDPEYDDEFLNEYEIDDDGNIYLDDLPAFKFGKAGKALGSTGSKAKKIKISRPRPRGKPKGPKARGKGPKTKGKSFIRRNPKAALGAAALTAGAIAVGKKAADEGLTAGEATEELLQEGVESAVQNDQCNPIVKECLENEGFKVESYPAAFNNLENIVPYELSLDYPLSLSPDSSVAKDRLNLDYYVGWADGMEGLGIVSMNADGSFPGDMIMSDIHNNYNISGEDFYPPDGECELLRQECYELADSKGFSAPFWVKCSLLRKDTGIKGTLDGFFCDFLEFIANMLEGDEPNIGESGIVATVCIPLLEIYVNIRFILWGLIAWKIKTIVDENKKSS